VETRLLIMEEGEAGPHVTTHVYLWNEEQTEATLHAAGKVVTVGYVDTTGAQRTEPYVVPNTNQCKDCHSSDKVVRPIGLVTRQLSRTVVRDGVEVDQIDWLAAQDALSAPPPADRPGLPDPFGTAPLAERARSWLEANCAHCHSPGGEGGPSGLWLHASVDEPVAYGVCKTPVAAGPGTGGNSYDIVPGKPDESILVYRITSTNPGIKMPELPNLLPHEPGVALVRQWIEAMTPPGCPDKAP
jgi:uncharacterized repeat protein (TIGR03806 family)